MIVYLGIEERRERRTRIQKSAITQAWTRMNVKRNTKDLGQMDEKCCRSSRNYIFINTPKEKDTNTVRGCKRNVPEVKDPKENMA